MLSMFWPFLAITLSVRPFSTVTHTRSPAEGDAGSETVVEDTFVST